MLNSVRSWLIAGALLTVPLLIKQNIGGAFVISAIAVLALEAASPTADALARAGLRWCLAGVAAALAAELLVLQAVIGIDSYVRCARKFAERRRPRQSPGVPGSRPGSWRHFGNGEDTRSEGYVLPVRKTRQTCTTLFGRSKVRTTR